MDICSIGIEAGIDITPSVEITFELEPTNNPSYGLVPGLGIKLKDNGGIQGNVAAKVRAYAEAGFFVGDFYGEAGGQGTLYFKTPPTPPYGYMDNFVLSCWIGGRIRVLSWTAEGWWTYTWSLRNKRFTSEEYEEADWHTLDRDYIVPDYNKYVWDNSQEYGRIIENAFPHAKPSIATFPESMGSKLMIVWANDNKDKSKVNGMELQYTIWEKDVGMNPPSVIPATDDDKLQMDPKIAFDGNGNVVCVFVQTDSTVNENTSFSNAAKATEIAYCIWDKNTETWSSINTITNNNRMDTEPVLASNNNGDIMLVWTSDADCDVTDPTFGDRSIYASFWNGDSWSTPVTLASNKQFVTTPNIALKDGTSFGSGDLQGIAVFTMDTDNNPQTTNDQNVYYMNIAQANFDNTIYQFTTDSYQDTSPSVVYGFDGNPYIIWLKNKYHIENDTNLYDGTLYYNSVGTRTDPQPITTGRVSDPVAIKSVATKSRGVLFHVGWVQDGSSYTLHYANVTTGRDVDKGAIYGVDSKLSETDWCIAPAGISVATVERPLLKGDNTSCNISFVYTKGYDQVAPVTSCSLMGIPKGYGINGPRYIDDVTVDFDASDEGYSGVEKTEYRIDYGTWETYSGSNIVVSSVGNHKVHFRSTDKAGNVENAKDKIFEIFVSNAPNRPKAPSGSTQGKPGVEYMFGGSTIDPDGDNIYYKWSIQDGPTTGWLGPYKSGTEVYIYHTWKKKGTYEVKIKARDINGIESDWSPPHTITVPRDRSVNNQLLLKLLEKILDRFPVLYQIIKYFNYFK